MGLLHQSLDFRDRRSHPGLHLTFYRFCQRPVHQRKNAQNRLARVRYLDEPVCLILHGYHLRWYPIRMGISQYDHPLGVRRGS